MRYNHNSEGTMNDTLKFTGLIVKNDIQVRKFSTRVETIVDRKRRKVLKQCIVLARSQ